MGQLISCCKGSSEEKKKSALDTSSNEKWDESEDYADTDEIRGNGGSLFLPVDGEIGGASEDLKKQGQATTSAKRDEELRRQRELAQAEADRRNKALREEQARLERIVSEAGRDMVAISRGAGSYDPAYAAAVARDLQEHRGAVMNLPIPAIPSQIPPTALADTTLIIEMLGRSRWDGIELGTRGGPGGCGGEDPLIFFDDVAESYLSEVLPAKETLFQGVGPIVENLP
jgi:hypothetical protein